MSQFKRVRCRVCGGALVNALDMGMIYPSAFLSEGEALPEKMPLLLADCIDCGLLQLAHELDLDQFYRTYFYRSGINPTMVAALKNVVDEAVRLVDLQPNDVVVDIGANDLTTLSMYPTDVVRVAFEPARNLPKAAEVDYFINEYFDAALYTLEQKAKIVTSLAMFYDLPDPAQFVRDVSAILDPEGVWIIQISDLASMFKTNSIDNPCMEHIEYYRTEDILRLVWAEGLDVFRIEHNEVNSGSLRFYVCWSRAREVEESVYRTRMAEATYFSSPEGTIEAFSARVNAARDTLVAWLTEHKALGMNICGIAASTKGNTLLQYFGIDQALITAIGDLNAEKFGKRTVGTNIPIKSEKEVLESKPDALLILSWHFLDFFLKAFHDYMAAGGMVITPLPVPRAYFISANYPHEVTSAPLVVTGELESGD